MGVCLIDDSATMTMAESPHATLRKDSTQRFKDVASVADVPLFSGLLSKKDTMIVVMWCTRVNPAITVPMTSTDFSAEASDKTPIATEKTKERHTTIVLSKGYGDARNRREDDDVLSMDISPGMG